MKTISLIVYPASDLAESKRLFSKLLGSEPYVDGSYYVGYKTGDIEIGLDPKGHERGASGALAYWTVSDIESDLKELIDAGAELVQDVTDVGYGMLIAIAKDGGGSLIGLRQMPA